MWNLVLIQQLLSYSRLLSSSENTSVLLNMQMLDSNLPLQRALLSSTSPSRVSLCPRRRANHTTVSSPGSAHYPDYPTTFAAHQHQKQLPRSSKRSKSAQEVLDTGGVWRFLNLEVPAALDSGKDDYSVSVPLLDTIASLLGCPVSALSLHSFQFNAASLWD